MYTKPGLKFTRPSAFESRRKFGTVFLSLLITTNSTGATTPHWAFLVLHVFRNKHCEDITRLTEKKISDQEDNNSHVVKQ
jgi:hypothetical protein